MDQVMISYLSRSCESKNPIKESKLQLHKYTRNGLPKWCYGIKDYVFLVSPTEFDNANYVSEALWNPKKDEWLQKEEKKK